MNLDIITNEIVKRAIDSMNRGDSVGWFDCFAERVVLTDDGKVMDFVNWSNHELFGDSRGYIVAINKVEDKGLTIYAQFHSEEWGEFETFMKFKIEDDKITRLDVGQVT